MGAPRPIALQGLLNVADAQSQREQLLAALPDAGADLVLDLSGVDAFDSAGVQLLLATRRSLAATGGRLLLRDCPPVVADVLALYGLQALQQPADAHARPATDGQPLTRAN